MIRASFGLGDPPHELEQNDDQDDDCGDPTADDAEQHRLVPPLGHTTSRDCARLCRMARNPVARGDSAPIPIAWEVRYGVSCHSVPAQAPVSGSQPNAGAT